MRQGDPYLAAADLDTYLPSSLDERVQRPISCLSLVFGPEYAVGLGEELARWVLGDQRDDLRAFQFCNARPAPGSGAVSETIYALGMKRWMRSRTVLG